MTEHVHSAPSWKKARQILESLRPDLPISFGTGNPICRPHVRAVHLDADAGEGEGYRVAIKPYGDGYAKPSEYFLIYVKPTSNYGYNNQPMPLVVVSEAGSNYLLQRHSNILLYSRWSRLAAS